MLLWGSGGMVPRKILNFISSKIVYINNYSYFRVIKSNNYLKFNMDIITNSVRVGDCSIRISDCTIRVFKFFAANNGGWGRRLGGGMCPLCCPSGSTPGLSNYCTARISVYVLNSANAAARNICISYPKTNYILNSTAKQSFLTNLATLWMFSILLISLCKCGSHIVLPYSMIGTTKD